MDVPEPETVTILNAEVKTAEEVESNRANLIEVSEKKE